MKKKALTLLEIMIVIFLITIITGTIGYNMRSAMDKGKAFRSEQAKDQLRDLLVICLAEGANADTLAANPVPALKQLGLAKNPEQLILDGWKEKFTIVPNTNKTSFVVTSTKLNEYHAKQGKVSRPEDDDY